MNVQADRLFTVRSVDRWVALGMFVLGILTRLPFRSQILYHWDSVNFALAIEHFDVRLHQPHPPGTFVIYILFARLLNVFIQDPAVSLVWISVLMGGLAAGLIYILGQRWFSRSVGLVAALVMLTSPLIWFHSEVALSYMFEFFWVLVIVVLCGEFIHGSEWALFASALCMGLAGGIRPNTPVFLFPLWAILVVLRRTRWRRIVLLLIVMAIGVSLWVVPMVMMSGGPAEYWEIMQWWTGQHLEKTENDNIPVYVLRFGVYTFYALGFGLLAIAWAIVRCRRQLRRWVVKDWRAQVLLIWVLPAMLYYTLIHVKQPGHTFTIMPALVLVCGLCVSALGKQLVGHSRWLQVVISAGVIVGNGLLFLLGPSVIIDPSRSLFNTPTRASIHEYDIDMGDRLRAIHESFEPEDTVVLAGPRFFRLPDYYLREYQMPSLSYDLATYGAGELPVVLPPYVHNLVLLDDSVLAGATTDPHVQWYVLPDQKRMRYFSWDDTQIAKLDPQSLVVEAR